MIKAVLFDLDGTLLDTAPDFTLVLNRLLHQYELAEVTSAAVRETVSDGARALIKLGFGIDESNPEFVHYLERMLDLYREQIDTTRTTFFRGMEDLIADLDRQGLQWGIVTNKPSRFTFPLLEKFDALRSCGVVICADHLKHRKPDPEGLLKACERLGCAPDEAVYVGDHLRDIEAGMNAGMGTIAVGWGYYPPGTDLPSWRADALVVSPAEIRQFLAATS